MPRSNALVEWLEARLALSGTPLPLIDTLSLGPVIPTMLAGDPNGTPPDSPENRVDPNTTDSRFAGVGSVVARRPDGGFTLGSGAAISPYHILTAAHVLDANFVNGQPFDPVGPEDVRLWLNFGSDLSHFIEIDEVFIQPSYDGLPFNDDLAILKVSERLPDGLPIYPLYRHNAFGGDRIIMAGYGLSGYGTDSLYDPAFSVSVKRVGENVVDAGIPDDDLPIPRANVRASTHTEGFVYDFDGPTAATNRFGGGLTLGNDIETMIGFGDSGGPAFILDRQGELAIFGINTFISDYPAVPQFFGHLGGGIIVKPYTHWIDAVLAAAHSENRPTAQHPAQADRLPVLEDAATYSATGAVRAAWNILSPATDAPLFDTPAMELR